MGPLAQFLTLWGRSVRNEGQTWRKGHIGRGWELGTCKAFVWLWHCMSCLKHAVDKPWWLPALPSHTLIHLSRCLGSCFNTKEKPVSSALVAQGHLLEVPTASKTGFSEI